MAWRPLADRLDELPLILAGPVLDQGTASLDAVVYESRLLKKFVLTEDRTKVSGLTLLPVSEVAGN